jgi:uncharacterized integral membrane protein
VSEPNHDGQRSGGWPLSGGQTLAVVIVAVAAVFVLQNTERVTIDLFTVSMGAPLWLVLASMFIVGLVVGALLQRRRGRST